MQLFQPYPGMRGPWMVCLLFKEQFVRAHLTTTFFQQVKDKLALKITKLYFIDISRLSFGKLMLISPVWYILIPTWWYWLWFFCESHTTSGVYCRGWPWWTGGNKLSFPRRHCPWEILVVVRRIKVSNPEISATFKCLLWYLWEDLSFNLLKNIPDIKLH